MTPGTKLGHYEIGAPLGSGGMGQVFRAHDPRLGRDVALKVLPAEVSENPSRKTRFEQEARAIAALNHPNILAIHDIGSENGLSYIVTELVVGDSLRAASLPVRKVVDVAAQIADGLAAAHSAGITHRDLKPDNIMLTHEGRAKILDFGLAKVAVPARTASQATLTAHGTDPGTVLGTVGYMSPEQVRGQEADARSDIFSFGAILYELLSGQRAFAGDSAIETMAAIAKEDPAPLPDSVSPVLKRIVQRCLEKAPAQRFQAASDLAFALRESSTGTSIGIAALKPTRSWRWPVALGVALVAGGIGGFLLQPPPFRADSLRYTPIATDLAPETNAVLSPNGKTVAYRRTVNKLDQIFMRGMDASAATQITNVPAGVTEGTSIFWSRDSNSLFFISGTGMDRNLLRITTAGGQPVQILDRVATADISPDGTVIALWRITGTLESRATSLWISSPPGSPPKRFAPDVPEVKAAFAVNQLRFAPDGRKLLLASNDGQRLMIWLIPYPEGTPVRAVFAAQPFRSIPALSWMPDSRHVLISGSVSIDEEVIFIGDVVDNKVRRFTSGTKSEQYASVSEDGKRIFYSEVQNDFDIISVPLNGGPPTPLLATTRQEHSPSWSPDGKQLAYVTNRSGPIEIWVRSVDSNIERPVFNEQDLPQERVRRLGHLSFSPDGSRILFMVGTPTQSGPWVVSASGGTPVRVAPENFYSLQASWSPDGTEVLSGSMSQIWISKVGSDPSPIAIPGVRTGYNTYPQWSPRGDWIAWTDTRGNLQLTSRDGKRSKTLSIAIARFPVPLWSRDGSEVHFISVKEGHVLLQTVNVETGAVRLRNDLGPNFILDTNLPTWSLAHDGQSIAMTSITLRSDIWMLEGFLTPGRRFGLF